MGKLLDNIKRLLKNHRITVTILSYIYFWHMELTKEKDGEFYLCPVLETVTVSPCCF